MDSSDLPLKKPNAKHYSAASHISHFKPPCPPVLAQFLRIFGPPSPHKSCLTFNGFDCRKRTLLSRAYYYPRASYWDASVHLDSCSLFLPVVRQTGFPTATPSRITSLGPNSHLDGSRCHIRPTFVLPSFQNKTTHLALEHPHYSQCGPPQAAKATSYMQGQLSSLQICDLIPLLPPPNHSHPTPF